jgi:hypothetical protein
MKIRFSCLCLVSRVQTDGRVEFNRRFAVMRKRQTRYSISSSTNTIINQINKICGKDNLPGRKKQRFSRCGEMDGKARIMGIYSEPFVAKVSQMINTQDSRETVTTQSSVPYIRSDGTVLRLIPLCRRCALYGHYMGNIVVSLLL